MPLTSDQPRIVDWAGASAQDLALGATFLDTQAALRRVRPSKNAPPANDTSLVHPGTVVTVWQPANGACFHAFALGAVDTDPDVDLVSLEGAFGEALLGRRVRDQVVLPFKDPVSGKPAPQEGIIHTIRAVEPRA